MQAQSHLFNQLDTLSTIEESLVSYYEMYLIRNNLDKNIILREFDCWQGRADLVSAQIKGDFTINIEQAKKLSNLTNAQIVSLLHYRAPRSLSFIKKRLALTDQTIKRAVRELVKFNIIEYKDGTELIVLSSNFKLPTVEFNAYEAKLHNWKRALYQSIQYYGFSNYSWVIMPKKYIKPALENIELFKANGIGLIGVDSNGVQEVYHKAKKNQPRKKAFYLVGIGKTMQVYLDMM
jgi:DNA-binding MarR family transcriptional regulator